VPKVSFVIPVFDGDVYLSETLESVRNQTEKDIEIVVIDDCSPDYTAELMDWYRKKDERIVYHRFENNQGVCAARNYGNQTAKAEIICVSDQDDLSAPERAAFTYKFFQKAKHIDCLTSAYNECNVDGVPKQFWMPEKMTRELFEQGGFVWMHSSCAYRKKDILELPYRVEDTKTDDWVFLDDWTRAGKKFWTVKKVLANCRRLPMGVMNQRRQVQGLSPSYIL
jgi:glycosyltransferase involved in cell wall biosynthesis